jgi:hypothetical protein
MCPHWDSVVQSRAVLQSTSGIIMVMFCLLACCIGKQLFRPVFVQSGLLLSALLLVTAITYKLLLHMLA